MRVRTIGAAVLLAGCVALPAGPALAAPEPDVPELVITPAETVEGTTVLADGSCAARQPSDDAAPAEFPSGAVVSVEKLDFAQDVNLVEGEFENDVEIPVPPGTEPGEYTVTTDCEGRFTFDVLESPVLEVTPDQAVRGQTVIADGVCPGPIAPVQVFLDGEEVTVVDQQSDGRLTEAEVRIPEDAASGTHTVTTSCDGSDTVEVSIPVDPEEPPDPEDPDDPPDPDDPAELVPVPNLQGLTAPQAATVLAAGELVLAGTEDDPGTVTGQDPAPGALVAVGSSVTIELAVDDPSSFPLLPVAGGGSLLLLVLLGAPITVHGRRVRRERRWLEREVAVTPGSPTPLPDPVAPGPAEGLDIRLVVRRHRTPPQHEGPMP